MIFSPESIDAIGFIFSRCKITHTVHRLQYSKTSKHDEAHNGIIVNPYRIHMKTALLPDIGSQGRRLIVTGSYRFLIASLKLASLFCELCK